MKTQSYIVVSPLSIVSRFRTYIIYQVIVLPLNIINVVIYEYKSMNRVYVSCGQKFSVKQFSQLRPVSTQENSPRIGPDRNKI